MPKLPIFLLGVTLSAALSGCDSKTSDNQKNFAAAVDGYFAKKGTLCLNPIDWPVDVYETDLRQQKLYPDGVAGQMAALEAAGLAQVQDMELPAAGADAKAGGPKLKARRYTMREAAKPYLQAPAGKRPRLCYARKSRYKVIRWADPAKVGDHEESSVLYTFQLANVPAWARQPRMKEAFPVLGRNVDGERTQQEKLYVKLTPQGWEALGLND